MGHYPIGDNVRIDAIASPSTPDRLTPLQHVSENSLRIPFTWKDLSESGSCNRMTPAEAEAYFRALVAAGDPETELLPDGSGVYAVLPDVETKRRSSIPNPRKGMVKLRFEILKRDNFACVYCGAKAPDVQLVVDHVIPVAAGGLTLPGNLAAACLSCNQGKGGRSL